MYMYAEIILLLYLCITSVLTCEFPDYVVSDTGLWTWRLRQMKDRNDYFTVKFVNNRMFVTSQTTSTHKSRHKHAVTYNRTCMESPRSNAFLLSHEELGKPARFMCLELLVRRKSVIQIRTSKLSAHSKSSLCNEDHLIEDIWPMVRFSTLDNEFATCTFSGGYDMKITDFRGRPSGCNQMETPMRLESECMVGDGVQFQFRYDMCVKKLGLPLAANVETLCVADWVDDMYRYSVLRSQGTHQLFCLRTPIYHGSNFTAELFTDFACSPHTTERKKLIKHVNLHLTKVHLDNLCSDEFTNCVEQGCTRYSEKYCLRSCGICNPNNAIKFCSFPKSLHGEWYQRDYDSYKYIHVAHSRLSIQKIGQFHCLDHIQTENHGSLKYALLTNYTNGCRPRYTCLAVNRYEYSSAAVGYTLSKSIAWPYFGSSSADRICEDNNFEPDREPIGDTFRTSLDNMKTIVATSKSTSGVPCKLRSVFTFTGTFSNNDHCTGRIVTDCADPTRLRIEASECRTQPKVADYRCVADFTAHYWERVITLQNMRDSRDTRCFMFSSVLLGQILVLPASQCDKQSWSKVSGGKRHAFGKLQYMTDSYQCEELPLIPSPTTRPRHTPAPLLDHDKLADGPNLSYPDSDFEDIFPPSRSGKPTENPHTGYDVKHTHAQTDERKVLIQEAKAVRPEPHSGSVSSSFSRTIAIILFVISLLLS